MTPSSLHNQRCPLCPAAITTNGSQRTPFPQSAVLRSLFQLQLLEDSQILADVRSAGGDALSVAKEAYATTGAVRTVAVICLPETIRPAHSRGSKFQIFFGGASARC